MTQTKNKPIIGIIPLMDSARESYWMLPGYMKGIENAGGLPLMLPLTDDPQLLTQAAGLCDGILFTGGHDVSPSLYHEEAIPSCGECCAERDRMESFLLALSYREDKPSFGICRGIQLMNVFLGGTLYQDLPTEHPSSIEHHQTPPYDHPCHTVQILPDTPLSHLLATDTLAVNSYHHQAIRKLAPSLRPMAYSPDGLVEAVYAPEKTFFQAVQWHPEFNYLVSDASQTLLRAFVRAAGAHKTISPAQP